MQTETIVRECKRHGVTEYSVPKSGYARCRKCQSEAVTRKRFKLKAALVEYKGGVCADCGRAYPQAVFDFHHRDPGEKSFGLSARGLTLALSRLKEEADKCDMLCANCHRIRHAEEFE